MTAWASKIDIHKPCWADYRRLIAALDQDEMPQPSALTRLLPPGTANQKGMPIRFVPASDLPGVDYERHVFEAGEVSTRQNNWHDIFNALAWCRFPKLKAAMNARHCGEIRNDSPGGRGKLRDALTLFDESGVIVSGTDRASLEALSEKDWQAAFITHRQQWNSSIRVFICGHAILEKFLNPYKSITAHALLLHTDRRVTGNGLDDWLGSALREEAILNSPACLSPIPLMGIPGWWSSGVQDTSFYRDTRVFRPDSGRRNLAPVLRMTKL